MKIIIALVFLFSGIPVGYSHCYGQKSLSEPVKILLLGSSYFNFHNLPGMLDSLAVKAGKRVYIQHRVPNGIFLDDHVDSYLTSKIIGKEPWDFVILQGVGSVTAYPRKITEHPVYPSLKKLQNKIHNNCETSKILFCMPWAFEDGMAWKNGWTDGYEEMQIKIYNKSLYYASDLGISIAPVGWAWYRVLQEKEYPLHYLHMDDWNHPSVKGSYLMACVLYSSIFGQSCTGISYRGEMSEEEAEYFQEIASETVLDTPDLWKLKLPDLIKPNHKTLEPL